MLPKITLEEFNIIKQRILDKMEEIRTRLDQMDTKNLTDEEEEKLQLDLINEYYEVEKELFNYDLSDIPFEAWEGLELVSMEKMDFSKTHANLDFSIVSLSNPTGVILKGCKLRKVDKLDAPYYAKNFDEEVIRENPKLFFSSLFSDEFITKYFTRNLLVEDLKDLTKPQIEELKTKRLRYGLRYTFPYTRSNVLISLIDFIDLERFIELYQKDEELLIDIAFVKEGILTYSFDNEKLRSLLNEENDMTILRQKINKLFKDNILNLQRNLNLSLFSETFKNDNSYLFPNFNGMPPELVEKLKTSTLNFKDILKYQNELKGIYVAYYFSADDYRMGQYRELLNENMLEVVTRFPTLFQNFEKYLDNYSIPDNFKRKLQEQSITTKEEVIDCFIKTVLKYYFHDHHIVFKGGATPDIYEETDYPDWVKEAGYYVSEVYELNSDHSPIMSLISSKTDIQNEKIKLIFDTFGYENVKRLHKEENFFSPRNIYALAESIEGIKIEPATDYEDFQDKLITAIFKSNGYNKRYLLDGLRTCKEGEFRTRNSDTILPLDAPKELQDLYYSNSFNLSYLLNNYEFLQYFENINLEKIGLNVNVNIYNSTHPNAYPQPSNFISIYLKQNNTKDLLKLLYNYKDYINERDIYLVDVKDLSKEALEREFKNGIYQSIMGSKNKAIQENSPEEFKQEHPELFISPDAPELLRNYFYNRYLRLSSLLEEPTWIEYLGHIDPKLIKDLPLEIGCVNSEFGMPQPVQKVSIEDIYIKKYGLKSYLEFISKYAKMCDSISKNAVIDLKDPSKESIEEQLEFYFYKSITEKKAQFSEDLPERFKTKYSNIFISPDAPEGLKKLYYSRQLKFSDIRLNPEYAEYIKDINFDFVFVSDGFKLLTDDIYRNLSYSIPHLLKYITKEEFLELIKLYGEYFSNLGIRPEFLKEQSFEELKAKIEEDIIFLLKDSRNNYNYIKYQENCPEFIKKALPEYFLEPDAPSELKLYYYQVTSNYQFKLELLSNHKEWIPYLKGKSVIAALAKINQNNLRNSSIQFIESFGQDTALKYLVNRSETVNKMISSNQVQVMFTWWLKTGKKFIPDYVVMQNLPLEDIDKFLSHGKEWSQLMRNKRFSQTQEGKDSMLKLAYCFGVFDGDTQGYKKLDALLNDIPRKLNERDINLLLDMEETILENNPNKLTLGKEEYLLLRDTLASEGLEIKDTSIIKELYRQNEDGSYTLTINTQTYPKSRELLRTFMEKNNLSIVISADKAHTLFGAFDIKYDRDFREFLLNNLEEFITNTEYLKYISAIQKQFQEIKIVNSNRVLTPALAVSFVQENKYLNVETGNDDLARVSGIAGYSQSEFETLQQIYAYGKTRVTSSIPRIYGETEKYVYEILRLTDPLAVAVGTLTDCCQEINNVAEVCMEHSMVDKNGRLFLIRDKEGNYISQSWVWRNGNVLCFDNVEIPDKQLLKSGMPRHLIGTGARNELTDEVLAIYKKAAEELIAADELMFKSLLESGKITEEQYEKYRLRKVTVGEGYNDIKTSITESFSRDKEKLARPLPFEPPVELRRELYVNDSTTQYVLENQTERQQFVDSTLPVHYDDFKILDKDNIERTDVIVLEKLEIAHGRYSYQLNTAASDFSSSEAIMDEICSNYGTDITSTKILINPNFAIVYQETPSEVEIVDVIKNKKISTEKVKLQMKLALLQIAAIGKPLNTRTHLYSDELKMIEEIMNISEEKLDEERGISRGI